MSVSVLGGSTEEVTGADPGHTGFIPLAVPRLFVDELCISGIELRLDPLERLGRWTTGCWRVLSSPVINFSNLSTQAS